MNPEMSLLELLSGDPVAITPARIVTALGVALCASLWIMLVYRLALRGALLSQRFSLALVGAALVTALVMIPISSNIILSLGMVGALSIVRFRAAIKDPIDIIFLFWAIAVGIASGAGFYLASLLGSAVIGMMLVLLSLVPVNRRERFVLVVRYAPAAEKAVRAALPAHRLRSRAIDHESAELVAEVDLTDSTALPATLMAIDDVWDAQLVSAMLDG